MDNKWELVEGLQCEDGNGESGFVASDDLHDQRGRYGSQSYRNEAADQHHGQWPHNQASEQADESSCDDACNVN